MLAWLPAALMLQALPPCELPDLEEPYRTEWSVDFRKSELPDGTIAVAMIDPMAEVEGGRLPGIPNAPMPGLDHSKHSRWLFSEASAWLLVPATMSLRAAAVGVDGSWRIEMQDAEHPERRFLATGTGACVGCAYAAGQPLFESYFEQARAYEFEFCRGLEYEIVREQSTEARLRYHYANRQGVRHDAVAAIGIESVGFAQLTVSGLDEATREEVLNAFSGDGGQ